MTAKRESEPAEKPKDDQPSLPPSITEALHNVQKAMEDLAGLLGADSTATLDALKQAGQAASENLADIADVARDRGREKLDDLSVAVRRNPIAWLAAAAGLGLVVGLWRNRGGRA